MSKGARLRAQRMRIQDPLHTPPSPKRPGEQITLAFTPGACVNTPDAIAAMQKQTHDGLIRMLGRRRRSGISWRHYTGRQAKKFLREAYAQPDPLDSTTSEELADGITQYIAFLDHYGDQAVLIVAFCEAVRPR